MNTAHDLEVTIDAIKEEGISSAYEIASALNTFGIATSQGKSWHASSVYRLLKRVGQNIE